MSAGWDDLEVGTEAEPFADEPLTRTDFVRYQGASGDQNPLHHDEPRALAAGFPSVFAVGMRQAGVMGNLATRWLGAANVRRFRVQFRDMAWPGDVLTYRATVAAKRQEEGRRLVDLEMTCTKEDGGVHLRGWATFDLT